MREQNGLARETSVSLVTTVARRGLPQASGVALVAKVSVQVRGVAAKALEDDAPQGDALRSGKAAQDYVDGTVADGDVEVDVGGMARTEGECEVEGRDIDDEGVDDVTGAEEDKDDGVAIVSEDHVAPDGIVAGDLGDECWPVACAEIWQPGSLCQAGARPDGERWVLLWCGRAAPWSGS